MACTWAYGTITAAGTQFEMTYTAGGRNPQDNGVNRPGEMFRFGWSLYRDMLTLTAVDGAVSPAVLLPKPWHRISTKPSLNVFYKPRRDWPGRRGWRMSRYTRIPQLLSHLAKGRPHDAENDQGKRRAKATRTVSGTLDSDDWFERLTPRRRPAATRPLREDRGSSALSATRRTHGTSGQADGDFQAAGGSRRRVDGSAVRGGDGLD